MSGRSRSGIPPFLGALLATALAMTGCAAHGSMQDVAPRAESSAAAAAPEASRTQTGSAVAGPDAPHADRGAYLDYADDVISATPGAKALFFHASWCPNCRALDEQLRTEGAPDGLTVFKVDYDERSDLRQRYGVTLQTTIVFVDDAGEPVSSVVLYDDPSIAALEAAIP